MFLNRTDKMECKKNTQYEELEGLRKYKH